MAKGRKWGFLENLSRNLKKTQFGALLKVFKRNKIFPIQFSVLCCAFEKLLPVGNIDPDLSLASFVGDKKYSNNDCHKYLSRYEVFLVLLNSIQKCFMVLTHKKGNIKKSGISNF
jgi:hypothetical protein